jgi:general secretion pathway protein D
MLVCLAAPAILPAAKPKAPQLYEQGRKAELAGDVVRAYLLYSQAAALDPENPMYWVRAQALQTQAALKARALPRVDQTAQAPAMDSAANEKAQPKAAAGFSTSISEKDLAELRRLRGPPELKPTPGKKDLDLRGNSKALFEQTARAFGLDTVFDGEYPAGSTQRLRLNDVDYRQALRAVEAATRSFVFPVGEHLIMVVDDTPQKRTQTEPTVAVTIPIPDTVTAQEAQEIGRGVQQTMEIQKLAVDPNRRLVLIKDRLSRVKPAQALFEQLAHGRSEVMLELQFVEVDHNNLLSYGFLAPSQFPIMFLGSGGVEGAAVALARFLRFGTNWFGIAIANAQLFATMNESFSKTLLSASVRSLDGEAASFHVGARYPILTATLVGNTSTTPGSALANVPSFNFEDLGLVLKVTPKVHGTEEVSLDIEAEFKVLSGEVSNGIPAIATRKLQSKVRVRDGEWALVAGMMSTTDAKTITGVPGLSQLPFAGRALRRTDRDRTRTQVVLLLRPILLHPPPDDSLTHVLWVGSETRLDIPL